MGITSTLENAKNRLGLGISQDAPSTRVHELIEKLNDDRVANPERGTATRAKIENLIETEPSLVHAKNKRGQTPLHVLAALTTHPRLQLNAAPQHVEGIGQCLAENGASFNVPDAHGTTPLHVLASAGLAGKGLMAMGLDQYGGDIHKTDGQGRTALHHICASSEKHVDISLFEDTLRLAIEHGADIDAKDYGGKRPAELVGKENPAAGHPIDQEKITAFMTDTREKVMSSRTGPRDAEETMFFGIGDRLDRGL